MVPFNEATQIVVTHNGVTMLKPHWMDQEYWQQYEVPRCGKRYSTKGPLYGANLSQKDQEVLKESLMKAEESGECLSCKI